MNLGSIIFVVLLDLLTGGQCHDAITSSGRLVCGTSKICVESDRQIWRNRRANVQKILDFKEQENSRMKTSKPQKLESTTTSDWSGEAEDRKFIEKDKEDAYRSDIWILRYNLCLDDQTAGFLLNNKSDEWPLACLWTASDVNGTCAPSKPSNRHFDFIDAIEWRKKIKEFRVAVGCSSEQIQLSLQIQELYICRDHCTQAGIGYFLSLFIMISLVMVLGVFCF